MRIRHVAMEVVMESASLKSVKIIISRTSLQERMRTVFYEPMEDTSAALHYEQPQADVRSASIRYEVKKKRSAGGRRVVKEFSEREAGCAGLMVRHQPYYFLELDAIRADEINTYGRPRGWIVWMGY